MQIELVDAWSIGNKKDKDSNYMLMSIFIPHKKQIGKILITFI